MKKPEIAKLVAAALEAEFGSYRNAELQHITAWNDGQHGESKAVCLRLTKIGESRKAFKDERLTWWRSLIFLRPHLVEGRMTWVESDDRRVTLDEAAGLLLGFSQTMTSDAKFTDDHKSNPRAPRLMSKNLVDAFTDMRGHFEVALQKKELFADGKRKIGAKDLITWAKENGCVADEVLAAWDAYQAEAGEAEQRTAPATSDAVQPEPEKPDAVQPEPQTAPETPGEKSIAKWLSVSRDYIAGVMREGRYGTAKELFNALNAKAVHESSPFEKGTGNNRGNLFVREIHRHVSLKTMQNNWSEIRSLP